MLVLKGTLICLLSCLLVGLTTVTVEAAPKENTAGKCSDGTDNDNDGLIDCDDPNCSSFCVPGGEIFSATAKIIQTFPNGCERTDSYDLSGCTPSDVQSECSGVSWNDSASTFSPECVDHQAENPLPGDVQTGLWYEAFISQWDIDPNTNVTLFKIREIEEGGFFGFLGLNTNQYGHGNKPNNMWANSCRSVDPRTENMVSFQSLPLESASDTISLVCKVGLTLNPNLNLRKGGSTLAQHPFESPDERLEVEVTRID